MCACMSRYTYGSQGTFWSQFFLHLDPGDTAVFSLDGKHLCNPYPHPSHQLFLFYYFYYADAFLKLLVCVEWI